MTKCPVCGGKAYIVCNVVQKYDPVDGGYSVVGRHYGDPEDVSDLKRGQSVAWGVWDCDECDDNGMVEDEPVPVDDAEGRDE